MTAISIILATYNRSGDLLRLLQAYEAQSTPEPFEVVVVDDASTDRTWDLLQSFQPSRYSLRTFRSEHNSGPGSARNLAIPQVQSPLVLFTGDDIIPDAHFLDAHLTAHRYYPDDKTAVLGRLTWPKDMAVNTIMTHVDGIGAEQFGFYHMVDGQLCDFRFFYTSNVSLKRKLLLSLDRWFDPDFNIPGFEDVDIGYRLFQKGMQIRYSSVPEGFHYHYHSAYSFAKRQYKSGLMAEKFVLKHPELKEKIFGEVFLRRLQKASLFQRFGFRLKKSQYRLEEISQRLMSHYEFRPNFLLDFFFTQVLEYYFHKGIIEASSPAGKQTQQISEIFCKLYLSAPLNWFLKNARKYRVPLMEGFEHIQRFD